MKKISQTLLLICFLGWVTPTTTTAQILAERLNLREKNPEKISYLTIDAAKDGDLLPLLISEAPFVQYLTITNLETFPKELYELKFLRALTITNSTFTTMPEFQGWPQWVNLRELYIQAQLTSVPEGMWDIRSLKYVRLEGNQLEEIPKVFIDNPYIEYLNLGKNRIKKIDTSLVKMVSLKELNLGDNQITHVPAAVFRLPSIERLGLKKNLIQSIDTDINEFCPVYHITLYSNQLITLPEELSRLKNLSDLFVTDNQLEDIPEKIFENKSSFLIDFSVENKVPKERLDYLRNKYKENKDIIIF